MLCHNRTMNRSDPTATVAEILAQRYPDADSVLLTGSVVRGETTETSDLDLIVLYRHLERSHRESFHHRGWPVEVFAHDPQTIEHFFIESDCKSGIGSMMHMVHDGVAIPRATALNETVKARAALLI